MWINLTRKQSNRSFRMPTAAHASIPPPGPPSRPERRKSSDRKKNEKEKLNDQSVHKETTKPHPAPHQTPGEIPESYGSSPSMRAKNAWGSPSHQSNEASAKKSEKGPWNRDGLTRKPFRVSDHVTDFNTERNMLPMWLEEARGDGQIRHALKSNRSEGAVSDVSFDSRWDSLNGGNKKQPPVFTVRPPGWEDVDLHGRPKRKKSIKKSPSFCPSFTINEVPKYSLHQNLSTGIRPLSPPQTSGTVVSSIKTIGSLHNTHDAFNMTEMSANVDGVISDSLLLNNEKFSMSNLAPNSASNSPTRTLSQSSASAIKDRHLWASTDSFICEDFSFCKGIPPDNLQEVKNLQHSPPRSFSEVLLNPQEMNEQHLTSHDETYEDIDIQLNGESFAQGYSETDSAGYSVMQSSDTKGNASSHYDAGSRDEGYSGLTTTTDGIESQSEQTYQEISFPSFKPNGNAFRGDWIRFDCESSDNVAGSSKSFSCDSAESTLSRSDDIDFVPQSNFDMYDGNPSDPVNSPTSPVLYRHFSGSTLNLVEPRLQQTPEIYTGQLVRNYSIRGKRASKRVTRTVSQKMKPAEYGKLIEPVAPMFSKAALTMSSGPGLFEQNIPLTNKEIDNEEETQVEETIKGKNLELPVPIKQNSNMIQKKNSSLSPGLPNRSGSLRVPRLPSIFLRRSLSLNTPKVSRGDVPFQRLPERRGSFRKAISGIGAIARNFRRRPGERGQASDQLSHITDKTTVSVTASRLHRSGSIGSSLRQTPKAPRLPRRTISHRQNSSNEPN
ncbi:uncharacterized protein [Palaemon carinicauda]|uniref:uncharacterized protein isoform X2 n=2 Tax=Palaemon carinicauda TaxID=392227 RepID=UPI0035B67EC3